MTDPELRKLQIQKARIKYIMKQKEQYPTLWKEANARANKKYRATERGKKKERIKELRRQIKRNESKLDRLKKELNGLEIELGERKYNRFKVL